MQTTEDFFNNVQEMLQDTRSAELQHRKDERLTKCMKVVVIAEKENGGRKMTWWRCKDPRCNFCNNLRGQALRARVELAISNDLPVYYARLPRVGSSALCKVIGADHYIRIPQPHDEDVIFYTTLRYTTGEMVTPEFIANFDWTTCATKQTNRIMSGLLGKGEKPKKPFGPFSIEVHDIVAGPKDVVDKAISQTLGEVIVWVQPSDLAEHQRIRSYFNGILVKNIVMLGGEIIQILKRRTRTRSLFISTFDLEQDYDMPVYPDDM